MRRRAGGGMCAARVSVAIPAWGAAGEMGRGGVGERVGGGGEVGVGVRLRREGG
jgi:hypothetical protein